MECEVIKIRKGTEITQIIHRQKHTTSESCSSRNHGSQSDGLNMVQLQLGGKGAK